MILLRFFPQKPRAHRKKMAPSRTSSLRARRRCKITTALPPFRQVRLHALHSHAVLLNREIKTSVNRPQTGRHVRPASRPMIHRRLCRKGHSALRPIRRPRNDRRTPVRLLLCRRSSEEHFIHNISVPGLLSDVPHDVDVVWCKAKLESLCEVARCQGKANGKGEAEPKICGLEKEVIIPKNFGTEPSRRYDIVNGLKSL